jgi:putative transposase
MPNYHRILEKGGTYFLTLVIYQRRKVFSTPEMRDLFRESVNHVMTFHPFSLEAYCILPDHIHLILRLPENDADYSMRVRLIKTRFTKGYLQHIDKIEPRGESRNKRREANVWQRRFWEHFIQYDDDLHRHIEYIHYNPVKHGVVGNVRDWPDSSFMDYVKAGIYDLEWGDAYGLPEDKFNFGE